MQARLTLLLAPSRCWSPPAGATLFWRARGRAPGNHRSHRQVRAHRAPGRHARARGMDELAAALDNMRAGHGHLGIWIEEPRPPGIWRGAARHPWNGWRATKWSCTRPTARACAACAWRWTPAPGAVLTVAVGVGAGARLPYAHGTALLLICALWVGATVMLAAGPCAAAWRPLAGCRNRLRASSRQPWPCACHCTTPTANCRISCVQPHAGPPAIGLQQMEGFNADVAQLRTPLATLINGTQVMLSRPRRGRAARCAGIQPGSAGRPEDHGQRHAVLARADRGERAADRSAISLAAEARRVAELRRRAGRARHPPLRATRPSRPIPVCAARWPT